MSAIGKQEAQLFGERLADIGRHASIVHVGFLREAEFHVRRFVACRVARVFKAAIASSALLYGPCVLPFLASCSPSARWRSTRLFGVKVIFPSSTSASRKSPISICTCSRTCCGITI